MYLHHSIHLSSLISALMFRACVRTSVSILLLIGVGCVLNSFRALLMDRFASLTRSSRNQWSRFVRVGRVERYIDASAAARKEAVTCASCRYRSGVSGSVASSNALRNLVQSALWTFQRAGGGGGGGMGGEVEGACGGEMVDG